MDLSARTTTTSGHTIESYPAMDRDFQKRLTFFYSKEESAWRFCHRKLQKSYPFAHYKLVSGYGHVGYPGEHLAEYCDWLSAAARGDNMTGTFKRTQELKNWLAHSRDLSRE